MDLESREDRMDQAEAPKRRPGRPSASRDPANGEREAAERGSEERETTEREFNDTDAVEFFRDSQLQSVLPNLPPNPEYHFFWATTSNPRDSVQWRLRLGYELVRVEDVPGWDGATMTTAGYSGVIGINEMVAMRIRKDRYNRFMREVHHEMPLQEEMKLRNKTDDLREQAQRIGARLEEGDGTAEIVQRAKPPPDFD